MTMRPGRDVLVPACADIDGFGVVLDHLVRNQEVEDRFRQSVGITPPSVGQTSGDGDDHRTGDAGGALGLELPALCVANPCSVSIDGRGRGSPAIKRLCSAAKAHQ